MRNKEKFLKLVSTEKTSTVNKIKERIKNRAMLRESQQIALKVLVKLDELKWSQKVLAEKLLVSPQQVTKIVSGKENLTIETQIKLQNILNIPVLASYYENQMTEMDERVVKLEKRIEQTLMMANQVSNNNYQEAEIIKMKHIFSIDCTYQEAI